MKTNLKTLIQKQPYHLFLFTALLLFLFSFFTLGRSFDFQVHDTYFVVPAISLIWSLTFITLIIWIIYKLTSKILWASFLTWFHVITSLIVLLLLLTSGYWVNLTMEPGREYITFQTYETEQQRRTLIIIVVTILFVGGQIAFATNLIGGLIKKSIANNNNNGKP